MRKLVVVVIQFFLLNLILVSAQDFSFHVRKKVSDIVAIELTKMNVVYIGIDNPVLIAAAREISNIKISNGSIIDKDSGNYIIRVSEGRETSISIFTIGVNGKDELLTKKIFRVKRVPDPIAKFGGKYGSSTITRTELLSAIGVIADLENFDFDLKFQVLEFDVTATIGGFELNKTSKTNMVTEEQRNLLRQLKSGQKVYIENIKIKGEDGTIRTLAPINLKII